MTKLYLEHVRFDDYIQIVLKIKEEMGISKVYVHYNGNQVYGSITVTSLSSGRNYLEYDVLKIVADYYQNQKKEIELKELLEKELENETEEEQAERLEIEVQELLERGI